MRVIERPVRIRALSMVGARGLGAMCTGCFTARVHRRGGDALGTIRGNA